MSQSKKMSKQQTATVSIPNSGWPQSQSASQGPKNLPKSAPNPKPPLSQALQLKVWQPWVESEWRFAKPTNNLRVPQKKTGSSWVITKNPPTKNTLPNFEDEKNNRHNNWRSWILFIISMCHRKFQNVAWPLLRGRGGIQSWDFEVRRFGFR